jgi:hypothetical protein
MEEGRMKRIAALVLLLSIGGSACGSSGGGSVSEPTDRTSEEHAEEDAAAPMSEPSCDDLPLGTENLEERKSPVLRDARGEVPATANIYAAGLEVTPQPGTGGGGVVPPVFRLPAGVARILTFPRVIGRVNPINWEPNWNGPSGDGIGPTDVRSLLGISGIVHRTNGMFLTGVFLTDEPTSSPAPPRLDFSDSASAQTEQWVTDGERFDELAPQIGQTFLIGDGSGHRFVVPDEATRLFLGFADAFLYEGCPGWYGNNAGHLRVEVEVTTE